MATTTTTGTSRARRATKKEWWHGTVNGYTNHTCRCTECRAAFAQYQTEYRKRRFDGKTCAKEDCDRAASKAAGNGLCAQCNEEVHIG